jgi:hypothetical protein
VFLFYLDTAGVINSAPDLFKGDGMDKLLFGDDDLIQSMRQIKPKFIKLKNSDSPCLYYINGVCRMCEVCSKNNQYIDERNIKRCTVDGDSRIGLLLK